MAANTSHIWPLTPICTPVRINNGTGTSKVTLYTPGTDGGTLRGVEVTSTDTAARLVQVFFTVGGTDYLLGTVSIPALTGDDGTTPALNLLTQLNIPALGDDWSWFLPSTAVVKLATTTTVTSGKQIDFTPRADDY